jgi:hypothetical protein
MPPSIFVIMTLVVLEPPNPMITPGVIMGMWPPQVRRRIGDAGAGARGERQQRR